MITAQSYFNSLQTQHLFQLLTFSKLNCQLSTFNTKTNKCQNTRHCLRFESWKFTNWNWNQNLMPTTSAGLWKPTPEKRINDNKSESYAIEKSIQGAKVSHFFLLFGLCNSTMSNKHLNSFGCREMALSR